MDRPNADQHQIGPIDGSIPSASAASSSSSASTEPHPELLSPHPNPLPSGFFDVDDDEEEEEEEEAKHSDSESDYTCSMLDKVLSDMNKAAGKAEKRPQTKEGQFRERQDKHAQEFIEYLMEEDSNDDNDDEQQKTSSKTVCEQRIHAFKDVLSAQDVPFGDDFVPIGLVCAQCYDEMDGFGSFSFCTECQFMFCTSCADSCRCRQELKEEKRAKKQKERAERLARKEEKRRQRDRYLLTLSSDEATASASQARKEQHAKQLCDNLLAHIMHNPNITEDQLADTLSGKYALMALLAKETAVAEANDDPEQCWSHMFDILKRPAGLNHQFSRRRSDRREYVTKSAESLEDSHMLSISSSSVSSVAESSRYKKKYYKFPASVIDKRDGVQGTLVLERPDAF